MPELPEATTIARGLDKVLAGRVVRHVLLNRRDFLKTGSAGDLALLAGAHIVKVSRRGKSVVFDFRGCRGRDHELRLLLQLGMAGRVYVQRDREPMPAHTHLVIELAHLGGHADQIRCVNARRIAAGAHLLRPHEPGPTAGMGPDADQVDARTFIARVGARATAIKAAIMNPAVIAGVGNIYSDEALFRARIRPARRARTLTPEQLRRLHEQIQLVLQEAILSGGSTIKGSNPFAGAGGELGVFTTRHRVYGRYGQKCVACAATLKRATIGGRTSTYCPRCQR